MNEEENFTDGVGIAFGTVHSWITGFYSILPNIIVGICVLVIMGLIAYSLRRAVNKYFTRKDRIDLGRIVADFCFWIFLVFGFLVSLTVIIPSFNPADLVTSLGLGSLAVGFAFKDILQNWLAGLLILLRLPFRRGDQIIVNDVEGTVQRIEPRATIIRTYDGRDIVIPNTTIYTNVVTINTSQPYRRVELDFTVGYTYEIRRLTQIIEKSLSEVDEILKDPSPQILCWDLGSTSLAIKLRWWIKSDRSQEVVSRARAVQAIKEAFDANDIDPTDPQLIYYNEIKQNSDVSKTGTITSAEAPPPAVKIAADDPESQVPKQDHKDQTMLPEN